MLGLKWLTWNTIMGLCMIVFGSIVHASANIKAVQGDKIIGFIALMSTSAFSGFVTGLFAYGYFGYNIGYIGGFAGVGAFLGIKGLTFISETLLAIIAAKGKK